MNNRLRKIGCLLLSSAILLSTATGAFASTESASSEKEEVIYINLNSAGDVSKAYAVNIFNGGGNITDYGSYSSVKNMNTDDEIKVSDDKISVTTDSSRLYYEGYLDNVDMPWNISIKYSLDGNSITADKLAGASGHLKITIDITKNDKCDSDFFNAYALQTTVLLDTNLCENIQTEDATEANVGSDKQLLYTLLPGKSKTLSVEADVVDFQMNAITFNGVRMNLGLNSSTVDTSEIDSRLDLITAATNSLYDGSKDLNGGIITLKTGVTNLSTGIHQSQTAINTLSGESDTLTTSSSSIKSGVSSLYSGLTLMSNGINQYEAVLSANSGGQITTVEGAKAATDTTISQLQTAMESGLLDSDTIVLYKQIIALLQAGSGSEEIVSTFKNQLNPSYVSNNGPSLMYGVKALNDNYASFDTGLNTYTDGVDTLAANYGKLATGSDVLLEGLNTLSAGSGELVNGAYDFKDSVSNVDVNGSIDNMLSDLTGSNIEVKSFVSNKNTNVDSVQFVIKSDEIKNEKVVSETKEDTSDKSLWDKIIDLFK